MIADLPIHIQIFLHSDHLKSDFMNLQEGRRVDRNQFKSMR